MFPKDIFLCIYFVFVQEGAMTEKDVDSLMAYMGTDADAMSKENISLALQVC